MEIPATPTNVIAQTANSQNFISWDTGTNTPTSYLIKRSQDNITFSALATVSPVGGFLANNYLDTAVVVGATYYYQVAAANSSGTSAYASAAQSVTPVPNGEMSLGQIRLMAQQRADRVGSQFVTAVEWNTYINQSLFELYDLLITQYGEEYFTAIPAQFYTNGTDQTYPLPDGFTSFMNGQTGATGYVAPAFYKLLGIDLGLATQTAQPNNGWVNINKFNFAADRNKYFYPNTASTLYGVFNLSYRLMGNNLQFIPAPSANQPVRIWYIPRMTMLLKDTDITTESISGWTEYVVVDAAIKALQKEESDVSVLMAQKQFLTKRIEAASMNRDAGRPDTIADTRGSNGWGGWGQGPANGFGGGW